MELKHHWKPIAALAAGVTLVSLFVILLTFSPWQQAKVPCVVSVEVIGDSGIATGWGVVLSDGRVLTAWHLFAGDRVTSARIILANGQRLDVSPGLDANVERDLVITNVKQSVEIATPAALAPSPANLDDEVVIPVGFNSRLKSRVVRVRTLPDFGSLIAVRMPSADLGWSGRPVFNQSGEVIGVCSYRTGDLLFVVAVDARILKDPAWKSSHVGSTPNAKVDRARDLLESAETMRVATGTCNPSALAEALSIAPEMLQAALLLSRCQRQSGQLEAATAIVERFAEQGAAVPEYWLEVARLRSDLHQWTEARIALDRATSLVQAQGGDVIELADAWGSAGDVDTASKLIQRAVQEEQIEVDERAARVLFGFGRHETVIDLHAFGIANGTDPSAELSYWAAAAAHEMKKDDLALGILSATGPSDEIAQAWAYLRARVLYRLGDYEEAATSFRASLSVNSNHSESRYGLGLALRDSGKYAEAADEFEKLIVSDGEFEPEQSRLNCSISYIYSGRGSQAVPHLFRSIGIDLRSRDSWWWLVMALAQQGYCTSAVGMGRIGLILNSDDHSLRSFTVSIAAECGEYSMAQALIADIGNTAPESEVDWKSLAAEIEDCTRAALGERKK